MSFSILSSPAEVARASPLKSPLMSPRKAPGQKSGLRKALGQNSSARLTTAKASKPARPAARLAAGDGFEVVDLGAGEGIVQGTTPTPYNSPQQPVQAASDAPAETIARISFGGLIQDLRAHAARNPALQAVEEAAPAHAAAAQRQALLQAQAEMQALEARHAASVQDIEALRASLGIKITQLCASEQVNEDDAEEHELAISFLEFEVEAAVGAAEAEAAPLIAACEAKHAAASAKVAALTERLAAVELSSSSSAELEATKLELAETTCAWVLANAGHAAELLTLSHDIKTLRGRAERDEDELATAVAEATMDKLTIEVALGDMTAQRDSSALSLSEVTAERDELVAQRDSLAQACEDNEAAAEALEELTAQRDILVQACQDDEAAAQDDFDAIEQLTNENVSLKEAATEVDSGIADLGATLVSAAGLLVEGRVATIRAAAAALGAMAERAVQAEQAAQHSESMSGAVATRDGELKAARGRVELLEADLAEAQAEAQAERVASQQARAEHAGALRSLEETSSKLASAEARSLEVEGTAAAAQDGGASVEDLEDDLERKQRELESYESRLISSKKQQAVSAESLRLAETAVRSLRSSLAASSDRFASLQSDIEEIKASADRAESDLAIAEESVFGAKAEASAATSAKDSVVAQLALLLRTRGAAPETAELMEQLTEQKARAATLSAQLQRFNDALEDEDSELDVSH